MKFEGLTHGLGSPHRARCAHLRLTASRRRLRSVRATRNLLSDAGAFGLPLNELGAAAPHLSQSFQFPDVVPCLNPPVFQSCAPKWPACRSRNWSPVTRRRCTCTTRRDRAADRRSAAFDAVRYAQKANSNLPMLDLARRCGCVVDAVSAGEIERALAAGFRRTAIRRRSSTRPTSSIRHRSSWC
jgi:hypothetical protein